MNGKQRKVLLVGLAALFCASLVSAALAATAMYYVIYMPESKTINYQMAAYVNGTLWVNGTQLPWGGNETVKELDVLNNGNANAHVYFIVGSNLPAGWTETWAYNSSLCYPGGWLNGSLTLTTTGANGTYLWDSWIEAGP